MSASGPGSGSIMAAARDIASNATAVISVASHDTIVLGLPITGDPVDDLVAKVRPVAGGAVDALQVAALLEARGYNDRAARVEFGYADVFALATEIFQRLGGPVWTRPRREPPGDWRRSVRDVSHGALYLLPSVLFPAVIATVAPHQLVAALLAAGALGWVWAGGTAYLAYQLRGLDNEWAAGRVLACSSLAGLALATGVAVPVAAWTGGGLSVALLMVGVMAYQAASTVLLFYRGELGLAVAMMPAAAVGIGYLIWGRALLVWALGVAALCVVAALGVGVGRALRARPAAAVGLRALLRSHAGRLVGVVGYAALSAAFVLHAQVPYLLGHLDVVLAGVPLVVCMGVVEWRARRVAELSRQLLHRVGYPREFVTRLWLLISVNVAMCWLVVAAVGAAAVALLAWVGWLSMAGATMAAAQVVLAGAYLLAFLLAGHDRYGWLCAGLAMALVAHLGAAQLVLAVTHAPQLRPVEDIALFLGSAVLLHGFLAGGLVTVMGEVRRHR